MWTDRLSIAFALLFVLAGCGDDDMPTPMNTGTILLGEGSRGMFRAIETDDTLLLVRGCQGLQHVWLAVRTEGLVTEPALIQAVLTRDRDMEMVSIPYQVRVRFDQTGEGTSEITGMALVITEPDEVLEEDLTLSVRVTEVEDGHAMVVEATAAVHVDWGTEVCNGGDGGPMDAGDDAAEDAAEDAPPEDAAEDTAAEDAAEDSASDA